MKPIGQFTVEPVASCCRKLTVVLAIMAAIAVAAGRPAHAADQSLKAQYDAALADVHAAGLATSVAEIYPASAPDDTNAAPLYLKLKDDPAFASTQAETDSLAVLGSSPTSADLDTARAFLAGHQSLVDLVHQAAAMPDCVVPGRSTAKDPDAILFPEFGQIRRAARILAVESAMMAYDGHGADAVRTAVLGFKLANHGYQEPQLIGWLVGVAVDAITVKNLGLIMALNRNDPSVVSIVDAALLLAWHAHPLAPALSGETACAVGELKILRASSPSSLASLMGDGEQPPSIKLAASTPEAWHDFVDANGIVILHYYTRIAAVADDPYPAAAKEMDALNTEMSNRKDDKYTLAHIFCPVLTQAAAKEAQIEARVAITHAAAAVLLYKSAHGDYPGSLLLATDKALVDPFDLQWIRYRPDGAGFVVYSVGASGTYAGGSATPSDCVMRIDGNGVMSWK
jgi:hypothetical protein